MERHYTFKQLVEIAELAKKWVKPVIEKKEPGCSVRLGVDPIDGRKISLKWQSLSEYQKPKKKQEVCVDGISCPICRRKLLGR